MIKTKGIIGLIMSAVIFSSAQDSIITKPHYMIDDFEDGDIQVMQNEGRSGIWHLDNDGSDGAVQTPLGGFIPVDGGPEGSKKCAHTTGKGFNDWGAELNVNLNTPDYPGIEKIEYKPYDASKYDGIIFMAKGKCDVRLNLTTVPIVPTYYGGKCDDENQQCFDAHGKEFFIDHQDEWKEYRMDFSEAKQNGWGLKADFDPSLILALQFFFKPNGEFDFWVDNISFYKIKK